jgi:hypothetical protein
MINHINYSKARACSYSGMAEIAGNQQDMATMGSGLDVPVCWQGERKIGQSKEGPARSFAATRGQ